MPKLRRRSRTASGRFAPIGTLTIDVVREGLTLCCSYTKLPFILRLYARGYVSRPDFFTVLGEEWSCCDANGCGCNDILQIVLPDGAAPQMMSEAERLALAALPEHVTIYRGADRGVNEEGMCWWLDREVAARFPFYTRYLAKQLVLVTATVHREHIVAVKFDR